MCARQWKTHSSVLALILQTSMYPTGTTCGLAHFLCHINEADLCILHHRLCNGTPEGQGDLRFSLVWNFWCRATWTTSVVMVNPGAKKKKNGPTITRLNNSPWASQRLFWGSLIWVTQSIWSFYTHSLKTARNLFDSFQNCFYPPCSDNNTQKTRSFLFNLWEFLWNEFNHKHFGTLWPHYAERNLSVDVVQQASTQVSNDNANIHQLNHHHKQNNLKCCHGDDNSGQPM